MSLLRAGCVVGFVCLVMSVAGCGRGPSFSNDTHQELKWLGLEIHNAKPTTQAELEARSPDAKKLLASQNYVYLPGIDMKLSNEERYKFIVAYHKDTPTLGGFALSGDGSVKEYTKDEFAAAQKWDPNKKPTEAKSAEEKPAEPTSEAQSEPAK